jgi:hypothetical protein
MGVGTGSGSEQVRRGWAPDRQQWLAIGHGNGGLRRVDGRTGMEHAANRAAAIMGAMLAGLIGLVRGRAMAGTDRSRMQRIGSSDADGPRRSDRREYLHQQGNQDDWKKSPQPPAHEQNILSESAN